MHGGVVKMDNYDLKNCTKPLSIKHLQPGTARNLYKFVWLYAGIRWQITFSKIEFYGIYESQLSRRLYSPSLKDVGWIKDAQLIFLIFHTFVCNFFPPLYLLPGQIYRQSYEKLKKLIERVIVKLHPSNLVNTIFCSVF